MTLLLHRYRPHSVNALVLLAAADQEERAQALYAADMVWLTASIIHKIGGGNRFDVESPSARYRDMQEKKQMRPKETEAEIAPKVIKRLENMFQTFLPKEGDKQ